jgi:hypothetical protein
MRSGTSTPNQSPKEEPRPVLVEQAYCVASNAKRSH